MAKIVFVHGIWQGSISREKLGDGVWGDLRKNLPVARSGVDAPTYGSCYRRAGQMAASGRDVLQDDDLKLDTSWATEGPDELDEELLAMFAPSLVPFGTKMGADLQALGVGVFARSGLSYPLQALAVRLVCQVRRYLLVPAVRKCVKRRIHGAIGPDTQVVIAHSFGTLPAYEVLCERAERVPLLVTLGSPLGLPSVVKRVRPDTGSPNGSRPQVGRWVNFGAADDVVSIRQVLADHYDGVEDCLLPAGTFADIPHLRRRYLTTGPVTAVIGQALQ